MGKIAIKADAEAFELIGEVVGTAVGVAGDADLDVGAAGTENADAALDVGVGLILLTADDMGVLRGDVGVEVFVADIYDDVDIVDVEEGVGVVGKGPLDVGEEGGLGYGVGREGVVVILIGERGAGHFDAEGVVVFAIIEPDGGLIAAATGKGGPTDFVLDVNRDEAEMTATDVVGNGDDVFDIFAAHDGKGE